MIQDKTQTAVNGTVLFEGCNAVLDHLSCSLWANRQAVVRYVASLGKGKPSPSSHVLRSTALRLAEPLNMAGLGR